MIQLEGITKIFTDGNKELEVLKPTNVSIGKGEFVAIVGPSGSGKSTLLTVIGALQKPTEGSLTIEDVDVYALSENQRSDLRFNTLGFVLQGANLVPYLTIQDQFKLKLKQANIKLQDSKWNEIVDHLSIQTILNKYPDEISGGERQRAAIGLALILNPLILLADEPTASLDTDKAFKVVEILKDISKQQNTTVIMVTHDPRMLSYCDRILEMKDGVLTEK